MANKRKQIEVSEDERVLLNGNRRAYPGVEINYVRDEEFEHGCITIDICRDSECMSIDQFEVFIATFRQIVEIARRKETELRCDDRELHDGKELPQVEVNYDSACNGEPLIYTVSDIGSGMTVRDGERFTSLMEKLLARGRDLDKVRF